MIRRIIIVLLLIVAAWPTYGQDLSLDFDTKDYDGNVLSLSDRLDEDKNYMILFSAFWCAPCVRKIDDTFSQQIAHYRENYNLELIILNDDYYHQPRTALRQIRRKGWNFPMYLTDDIYRDLGVTSIPRYYMLPAGEDTAFRVYGGSFLEDLETFFLELGQEHFFSTSIGQVTHRGGDCDDRQYLSSPDSTVSTTSGGSYYSIGDHLYRSGALNRSIIRYDLNTHTEHLITDFSLSVCDRMLITDHQHDTILVTVTDRIEEDGHVTLLTDAWVDSGCGPPIPFTMSTVYGTNAGLVFDIEDGVFVSRLLCHTDDGATVFSDDTVDEACTTTQVHEDLHHKLYHAYPNPGNLEVNIELTDPSSLVTWIDINGKSINPPRTIFSDRIRFDTSLLPSGLYSVTIQSTQGSVQQSFTIVITH